MKKILVLFGGCGKEREVSINSAKSTTVAISELGFEVVELDLPEDLSVFIAKIKDINPDIVFNCLHGDVGENGTVQALLNHLKLPYTHSGMLASAMAMNKWQTYKILKANGIPTPSTLKTKMVDTCPMEFPCVVKPIGEGSSVGVSIIKTHEEWRNICENWEFGDECIVQEYLKCREIHVAIFNNEALSTIEICPNSEFFNYKAKYTAGESKFICPAPISEQETILAKSTALRAYQIFDCRGLVRVDMLFNGKEFVVLELNTQPGFTSTSLSPQIASSQGISFKELVNKMIASARCD